MVQYNLGPHEALEIHELLNFKTVCMVKSKMMQGVVNDAELKELMEQDVKQSMKAVQELQRFMSSAQTSLA